MTETNTTAASVTKPHYSLNEWCERNGRGRTFVYAEIKSGRLKALKMGSRTIITHEEDERYRASLPALDLNSEASAQRLT